MPTDSDCIFCKIVNKQIPAREVYRDAGVIAIEDINPQAPVHVLVIPVEHGRNLHDFAALAGPERLGALLHRAGEIGRTLGPGGYRVVMNEGSDGGQTVSHLHAHVLAGRPMGWPPFAP